MTTACDEQNGVCRHEVKAIGVDPNRSLTFIDFFADRSDNVLFDRALGPYRQRWMSPRPTGIAEAGEQQ